MSRLPVPGSKSASGTPMVFRKQVCVYAFSKDELELFNGYGRKGGLEQVEDIEILRFFELGIPVRMVEVPGGSKAVDVPEDVGDVESLLRQKIR
jgi:3-deoxy-manno-octulosonate cytidylyltransferase (CMP-KDO synthetase)